MIVNLNTEKFEQEVIDAHSFRLAYCPALDIYLMFCLVYWIASYERFYIITKEDYELYLTDKDSFYQKFSREIKQQRDCFTERFAGSAALRDYDGQNGFQHAFPLPERAGNAFQHYAFIDGVFYARIVWKDDEIFVPPVQAILKEDGSFYFPLRKKCEYQTTVTGQPVCYKLKTEYRRIAHERY